MCILHLRSTSLPKERGMLITVWLILKLVANLAVLLFYSTLAIYPTWFSLLLAIVPNWTVYFFAALSTFNVCVCFLFLWKKWAFSDSAEPQR